MSVCLCMGYKVYLHEAYQRAKVTWIQTTNDGGEQNDIVCGETDFDDLRVFDDSWMDGI